MRKENSIHAYMSFPKQIDPAHILTMVDLDLSYALASTLVEWDDKRQVVAGLSNKWEVPNPNIIRFMLRPDLKWSDGESISSKDILLSLNRAKEKYYDDLKSLFDEVKDIRCPSPTTIEFETKASVSESGILKKLTEPMYGLVAIGADKQINLKKSAGPFLWESQSEKSLVLVRNKNWFKDTDIIADRIELRPPTPGQNIMDVFFEDQWVNMFSSSSLVPEKRMQELKEKNAKIWKRDFDKVFFLSPSQNFLKNHGGAALKAVGEKLNIKTLLEGLSGYTETKQFFPRGYVIYDPSFKDETTKQSNKLTKSLKILMPDGITAKFIKDNLSREVGRITGKAPVIQLVKLNELDDARAKNDYDLMALNVAVVDPNFEGAMAFFFAGKYPLIPSGENERDFASEVSKIKSLKKESEKIEKLRRVISQATLSGHVLPLFHFSSLTIGKGNLDFSEVPLTRESVPFSLVRFQR